MAFLSTTIDPCFPTTNNQLTSSSNPRNQATIQDGRVIVQQVQGRQSQGYAGNRSKSNATASGVNINGGNNEQESGQVLDEEQLAFLADLGVAVGQHTQKTMPLNAAFQTDDLNAFDSYCDEALGAQAILMAHLSRYDSDVISEITSDSNIISYEQYLKETESVGVQNNTSSDQQNAMIMSVFDAISDQVVKCTADNLKHKELDASLTAEPEETLILAEDSRTKMMEKQNDLISKDRKVNISLINYAKLNKLSEDFRKRFVPQNELSAEQVFRLRLSNPISKQHVIQPTSVKTEAPCELLKVSLVKTSFQKQKNHLASFDKVVKVRTTPDVITEEVCGFEHAKEVFMKEVIPFLKLLKELFNDFDKGLNLEINKVKMVFEQMEVEVDQCSTDKNYIEIEKKELILDTERLLEHIICQDVKNVVMHAVVLPENDNCLSHDKYSNELLKCENDHLIELLISQDIGHTVVNSLASINDYKCMKKSFVDEYNETLELKAELTKKNEMVDKEIFIINELQAQLKAKNVSINNSKKHIANLKGKTSVEYAKTINKSNVVTSTIYKLDLQPLPPRIKNNREAHLDYLKVTQEHTNTLWDIVEQARALKPLYNSLDYAYQDTAGSKGKKVMNALSFYKMETYEISERYIAPCFVNGLEAYDGEINLAFDENLISNVFAVKLFLDYEMKKGKKLVKKELIVALKGELYFVKFNINPKEDDFEPRVILGRSFLRLAKGIVDFGNRVITIYPEPDPFEDDFEKIGKSSNDWD
ncbi:hypothetical protein Tco_0656681 [Tanacetum coccineum]|uniref:Uncharacterized protein n=1 Tax=Tanacetum coccineum TaxID=301880 RepID=A0ABQ4X9V6_9ASTR